MSTTLGGTGFVITKTMMREVGWNMTSLVEDFEFSTKAVMVGKKIGYAYDAITYDEKPNTLKASMKQRSRWLQGHWNVCIRMTLPLIWAMISNRKVHFWSALDYLIYLWSPGRLVIYSFYITIILVYSFRTVFDGFSFTPTPTFWITSFIMIMPRVLDYTFAVMEGFKWNKILSLLYFYTVFYLSWIPGCFRGLIDWRNQHIWDKTVHNVKTTVEKAGT
jgi:cellulose synthase/poly-beta-1,6-N-acetylglucosamine synthase-like glycosyltransferase